MKKAIIGLILIFGYSCERKLEFISLPNQIESGIYKRDDNRKGYKYYYKSILVKNAPEDKIRLKKQIFDYHKQKLDSVFSDKKNIVYITTFYKHNNATDYFINHKDDSGGFSSEILTDYYKENGIAEIKTTKTTKTIKTDQLITEITYPNYEIIEVLK